MKKTNLLFTILTLCSICNKAFCLPTIEPKSENNSPTAILQGLNKVTGKTSELKIKVGEEAIFGELTIKVKKCWRAPLDQRPENKILLEITDNNSNQESSNNNTNPAQNSDSKKVIFYGWMFSSSPSISGLEHPIYDITAISCK